MEPKNRHIPQNSIGKFISALRRASGMTQKELGERLYVSDKTVSRWERDECTPELSLIPAIAEIFGITTDELLRGERNAPRTSEAEESEHPPKRSERSDKQFRAMLRGRMIRFKNLTLLSVGLALAGLLGAMIANLGFLRGRIGFCVAAVFYLASLIAEICFSTSARLASDEEEGYFDREIARLNHTVTLSLLGVILLNVLLSLFTLPLLQLSDAYFGLDMEYWLRYGLIYAGGGLVLFYFLYIFLLRDSLLASGHLYYEDETRKHLKKEKHLLIRMTAIAASLLLLLGAGMLATNLIGYEGFATPAVFDNYEDFRTFMAEGEDFPLYSVNQDGSYNIYVEIVPDTPLGSINTEKLPDESVESIDPDAENDPHRRTHILTDKNGNMLCEYVWNDRFVSHIEWGDAENGYLPITVYTREAMAPAYDMFNDIMAILEFLIFADIVVCTAVYGVLLWKRRQNAKMQ